MRARGSPITAIKPADTAIANWGRCFLAHGIGGLAGGRSAIPSKRRIAASIAASRRAGRGGGGSGTKDDLSLSNAIYRFP
ncbi:MAG TPA: hypothetical protein VK485_04760 [Sphingomicrobium sp.]|nr:hypothetical protein [Sphingomicrobium sp.]